MRTSGILLPIFSLPGKYGIGDIGKVSFQFIDFLSQAGQKYWQILPIGPTGYGDSPYQSFSAYAGNPYFIDVDALKNSGFLTDSDIRQLRTPDGPVDYRRLFNVKAPLLKKAASRMHITDERYGQFCKENAFWLDDYALFMSIKTHLDNAPLCDWPQAIRLRRTDTIERLQQLLTDDVEIHKRLQYIFFSQWALLCEYAAERDVQIIGDIPIYVSADSSDVWTHPELFEFDENRRPVSVAGCPPDNFSKQGQLWGNPLYNWDYHKQTDYKWWKKRLIYALNLYDIVRIDHFRGFDCYYSIPADEETAENGIWRQGPSTDFIKAIKTVASKDKFIAEDLGFVTVQSEYLRLFSGFAGMKVIQFGFDIKGDNEHLPHNYEKNSVVYTGTHDNATLRHWTKYTEESRIKKALAYTNCRRRRHLPECMLKTALGSKSRLAVISLQDYLSVGAEGRINTPSTVGGNWLWRLNALDLNEAFAHQINELCALYGRSESKAEPIRSLRTDVDKRIAL